MSGSVIAGGLYEATPTTYTDGQVAPAHVDANGNLKVVAVAGSASLGTVVLGAGSASVGTVVLGAGTAYAGQVGSIPQPLAYTTLGHYSAVLTTGTIGAGMAGLGELVQMRWPSTTRFCAIQEVTVLEFWNVATAWTAGRFLFDVIKSTGWTVDGTGGGAVAVATPQLKMRTSMGATLFSTGFRLATTAALGAGTKTLLTLPFGATYGMVDAVAAKYHIPQSNVVATLSPASGDGIKLFKVDLASGEHPMLLVQDEGISIRATVPATGTWSASFLVKWAELAAF